MTRQMQARVTHGQFYAICQWLKNHADLTTPTTQQELAAVASKYLGFAVSTGTISEGLKTTQLAYTPIAAATRPSQGARSNDSIVLARAIVGLCKRLGEAAPVDVVAIAETGRSE